MSKLALFVVFNHRYDKNLPLLDKILKPRFSDIYYIVPFYDGDRDDVIPVYGRSIFFEGYLAQAYNVIKHKEYDHVLVIADDMIINPSLNENNYLDFFGVETGQSFIPMLRPLNEMRYYWIGTMSAFTWKLKQPYIEITNELPSKNEALKKFNNQGINITKLTRKNLFHDFTFNIKSKANILRLGIRTLTRIRHPFKKEYDLPYPMVGSYSDICLIAMDDFKMFAHYCGVFAATCLFVEVAIPTALVLAANKKIITENECKYKGRSYWASEHNVFCESPDYIWGNIEKEFKDLNDIHENFPKDAIYLHPVKLSKWKNR